jgi:hypothetical protein
MSDLRSHCYHFVNLSLQPENPVGSHPFVPATCTRKPLKSPSGPRLSLPFTMKIMFRRAFLPLCVVLSSLGLIAGSLALRAQDDAHHGRKYKVPPPSSRIEVTVVRDYNGKPIHDAHVIFHPIEGDKDKGALELKTNEDGKTIIDVIPVGDTVTLQVIAAGFQTSGAVYKIDKPNMSMEVRLKRPTQQYSTYKNSTPNSGAPGQSDPPSNPSQSQPPPK